MHARYRNPRYGDSDVMWPMKLDGPAGPDDDDDDDDDDDVLCFFFSRWPC